MSYKSEFDETDYTIPPFINEETGWRDNSWHNDTCPRFTNHKHKLQLWIGDNNKRDCNYLYSLQAIDADAETITGEDGITVDDVFVTDSIDQLAAYLLALEFSAVLSSWLTPEQMKEVIRLNATEEYAGYNGACASHNYCDSNQAMIDANDIVKGEAEGFDSEKHMELFNAAWSIAHKNNFFITFKTN